MFLAAGNYSLRKGWVAFNHHARPGIYVLTTALEYINPVVAVEHRPFPARFAPERS